MVQNGLKMNEILSILISKNLNSGYNLNSGICCRELTRTKQYKYFCIRGGQPQQIQQACES